MSRISVDRRTTFTQRSLTILIYSGLLGSLGILVYAIFPVLISQGQLILSKVESTSLQSESQKLLDRSAGSVLLSRQKKRSTDAEWKSSVRSHVNSSDCGLGWWQVWPTTFQASTNELSLNRKVGTVGASQTASTQSFKELKKKRPDLTMDQATFLLWNEAYQKGQSEFVQAAAASIKQAGLESPLAVNDFKYFTRTQLANEWWQNDPTVVSARLYLETHQPDFLAQGGNFLQGLIHATLTIPIQLMLSLVLAFLISSDVVNIHEQLRGLSKTRVKSLPC